MRHYLFQSPYCWAIAGLITLLGVLWYWWFKTDQIVSSSLTTLATGTVLLNIGLGFFAYDRHRYITKFLFYFSYGLLALVGYTIYSLSRGII